MDTHRIVVDSYFDGRVHRNSGPYTITLRDGAIAAIENGDRAPAGAATLRAAFLMPGLVEAHSHLFLDGGELDLAKRAAYLSAPRWEMMAVARRSLAQSLAAGVTLIRDAGDIHGVNLQLRRELQTAAPPQPDLRCAGKAMRKAGRYGSFMAREVTDEIGVEETVAALAEEADDIKVLLTGVIDFEAGCVKGHPQFALDEARRIQREARALGLRTFAHCSGAEGLDIAIAAGFDSIEHGFFVTRAQLRAMADRGIAWVPTFAPVHFQRRRPDLCGWTPATVGKLKDILDAHAAQLRYAYEIGAPVLTGSDAGSCGVQHGHSYIEELILMAQAGVDLEKILHSATALPRLLWGLEAVDIEPGRKAELALLRTSPFRDPSALFEVEAVYKQGWSAPAAPADPSALFEPKMRSVA